MGTLSCHLSAEEAELRGSLASQPSPVNEPLMHWEAPPQKYKWNN